MNELVLSGTIQFWCNKQCRQLSLCNNNNLVCADFQTVHLMRGCVVYWALLPCFHMYGQLSLRKYLLYKNFSLHFIVLLRFTITFLHTINCSKYHQQKYMKIYQNDFECRVLSLNNQLAACAGLQPDRKAATC